MRGARSGQDAEPCDRSCFENSLIARLDKPGTSPVIDVSALIEPLSVLRAAVVNSEYPCRLLFGSRVQASDILDGNFSRPLITKGVPEDFVLQLATALRVLLK